MLPRLQVLDICPSVSSMPPTSPSLLGVPPGPVPPPHRYYGTLRLPATHPDHSLPRVSVPPASCLRSCMGGRPHASPGVLLTQTSRTGCSNGDGRISQVPGEPLWHAALESAPVGPSPQAITGFGCCLLLHVWHWRPHWVISELTSTAYSLAVYASQSGLPPFHARLASGWRPPLPCGFPTRGVRQGGFRSDLHTQVIPSPSSRLCLALTWYLFRPTPVARASCSGPGRTGPHRGGVTRAILRNVIRDSTSDGAMVMPGIRQSRCNRRSCRRLAARRPRQVRPRDGCSVRRNASTGTHQIPSTNRRSSAP